MAVTLTLEDHEADYLRDILHLWIDGYEHATTEVEQDRSLDSPEEMLDAVKGMHSQFASAVEIQMKLREARERV